MVHTSHRLWSASRERHAQLSRLHLLADRCKLVDSKCKLVDSACKLVDRSKHKACTHVFDRYYFPRFAHCYMSQLGSGDWGWDLSWEYSCDWDWDWKVLPGTAEKGGRMGWLQHVLRVMRWALAEWSNLLA